MSETFSGTVTIVDSRSRQVFKFDSEFAVLDLGATGNEGDLRLRGDDGATKIALDGGRQLINITNADGELTIRFDGNTGDVELFNADCAEDFDVSEVEAAEPGTVMVVDQEGALKPSEQPYDKKVAGVISGAEGYKPGIILGKQKSEADRMPVALMGKVGCKVDAQYSPIEVGDLLTTSPTPGHAMKVEDHSRAFGATIGKALRPLGAGKGIVPTLIALQ